MPEVRADHPKQRLLAFVADAADEKATREMEALVTQLSATRRWTLGPPRFVDDVDDTSVSAPEDVPIRTVGVLLDVYSTWPPWDQLLPPEIDRANLAEVAALVDSLCGFSSRTGLQIDFELQDVYVGSIQHGQPDESLRNGFLGEWGLSTRPPN